MKAIFGTLSAAVLAAGMAMSSTAFAGDQSREGSFTGDNNHVNTGGVEVVKEDDGWKIILKENFSFDGAPDARVGFGTAGKFVDPTDFEPLRQNTGEQVYVVPADIDPSEYDTVVIWCRQYSVQLGHAPLK